MDKYEYKIKADEIKGLIAQKRYAEAMEIADGIDWRRVKSAIMLCTVSDLYKINRKYEESKELLLLAYDRHPGGRMIVYSLCELCIKMENPVEAIEYYKEFVQIAPKDSGRYILQYKLYESQDVSLEERIAVLEEFKKREYRSKWAYELAYLYHRVGLSTRCVEECDQLILWFGEGRFVVKAMELKMLHQPLTEDQEIKYALATGKILTPPQQEEIVDDETKVVGTWYTPGEAPMQPAEEEPEIHVKPVNVGEYATINLQKELAESMKEIFPEEGIFPEENLSEESPQPESTDREENVSEEEVLTEETDMEEEIPQEAETEEIAEEVLEKVTEEEPVEEIPSPQVTVSSVPVVETVVSQTPASHRIVEEAEEAVITEASSAKTKPDSEEIFFVEKDTAELQTSQIATAYKKEKESAYSKILSQEYDGQIRLVVPEAGTVERQITGQMNIQDILNEWERMKKETEQKYEEDYKQRILQQTGAMFTEFDVASRTGVLAQLEEIEKSDNDAIAKVVDYNKYSNQQEELAEDESVAETIQEESENYIEEPEDYIEEEEVVDDEVEELAEIETAEEEEEISATEVYAKKLLAEDDEVREYTAEIPTVSEVEPTDKKLRTLTDDEKELFATFIQTKEMKKQLIETIDKISLAAYTGNVIITGETGSGTIELAKNLVKEVRQTDSNFSGKIAKISAKMLNKKDIEDTLSKLVNGALIIEKASDLEPKTIKKLNKALEQEKSGIIVILEDRRKDMNKLLEDNHTILNNFNARIDVEALDNNALVEYGKKYAESLEYSIDEMGVLALYTRIADMQTIDHIVTISDVKDLIDTAIDSADKKNMKHFMDLLFAKRYDDNDMIILRERDFIA